MIKLRSKSSARDKISLFKCFVWPNVLSYLSQSQSWFQGRGRTKSEVWNRLFEILAFLSSFSLPLSLSTPSHTFW